MSILDHHAEKWMPEPNSGCFLWLAGTMGAKLRNNDYPALKLRGRMQKVHRVVCSEMFGPLTSKTVARHTCGNRFCVNPGHIRPGSQSKNMADRWERHGEPKALSLPTNIDFHKQRGKYRVRVRAEGVKHELGLFASVEDALATRDTFRANHGLEPL